MADRLETNDLIVFIETREYMDDHYGYDGIMDIGMLSVVVAVDLHEFYVTGDGARSHRDASTLCCWIHKSYVKKLKVRS